jgi:hypothetical protein
MARDVAFTPRAERRANVGRIARNLSPYSKRIEILTESHLERIAELWPGVNMAEHDNAAANAASNTAHAPSAACAQGTVCSGGAFRKLLGERRWRASLRP